jgi:hypothetical protein
MVNGIVKAAFIVGIAVMADQFFTDGTYTDAALSMLRQDRAFIPIALATPTAAAALGCVTVSRCASCDRMIAVS